MELDLFKSFLAVAEARSFSRAAHTVHSTQPTLSRQIGRLESELGTRLFERYGRHVELTFNGQLLLPLAQAIVARTEDAISLMKEQAGAGASTVRLGAVGNEFALVLPPIIVSFLATYPKVTVYLIEKDDAALEEAVISGELDCAVITPWGSSRAATQYLMTEDILLLVPQGHRLAAEKAVTVEMLAHEAQAKAVQGADMREVEERELVRPMIVVGGGGGFAFKFAVETLTHLGGGGLGEGDDEDFLERRRQVAVFIEVPDDRFRRVPHGI